MGCDTEAASYIYQSGTGQCSPAANSASGNYSRGWHSCCVQKCFHVLHASVVQWLSALVPGQYMKLWAQSWHLVNPRWPSWIVFSTSYLSLFLSGHHGCPRMAQWKGNYSDIIRQNIDDHLCQCMKLWILVNYSLHANLVLWGDIQVVNMLKWISPVSSHA